MEPAPFPSQGAVDSQVPQVYQGRCWPPRWPPPGPPRPRTAPQTQRLPFATFVFKRMLAKEGSPWIRGVARRYQHRPESASREHGPLRHSHFSGAAPSGAALLCCPPARSLPWVGPEFGARPSTPLTTPSSPRPSSAFAVGLSSARPSDDRRMLSSTARPSSTLRGGCPWSPGSMRTVAAASKAVMTSRQRLGGADRLGSAARKDGFSAFPWLMSHFLRSLLWGARRIPGRGTPGAQVWTRSLPRWPGVQAQRAEAPALSHDCHTLSAGHVFTC